MGFWETIGQWGLAGSHYRDFLEDTHQSQEGQPMRVVPSIDTCHNGAHEYTARDVPAHMEQFEGMSHEAIYHAVQSFNPGDLNRSQSVLRSLATGAGDAAAEFQSKINGIIDNHWSGESGQAASAGIQGFVRGEDALVDAANDIAAKIGHAEMGLEQAKRMVPPPQLLSADGVIASMNNAIPTVSPMPMYNTLAAGDEARNEAVRVMNSVYKPAVYQADTDVPALPRPVSATAVDASQPPAGYTPGGG